MNRQITWCSNCFDEIELVYEKAEKDPHAQQLLLELEQMALAEAAARCGWVRINDKTVTRAQFEAMSDFDKEKIIYLLSGAGLAGFEPALKEPVIEVTLSAVAPNVLGCTMFSILNRLEKLDGAYNVMRFPKANLRLHVPLGGRKGLMRCGLLIMELYPWLSVGERATNEVAVIVPEE